MAGLRRFYRMLLLLPHLVVGLWGAVRWLPADPPPRTEGHWHEVRRWHRRTLELIGVDLRIRGEEVATGPVMFVANHVSWIDIGALSTTLDASFIGKHELRDWPVLGLLIRRAGTIFIHRGGPDAAAGTAREMARRLDTGWRVAVFPEGTTTTGQTVARFHPRLFDAALRAGVPVQPISLVYGNPAAAFVGNEPFVRHLWRVLGARRSSLEIRVHPPLSPEATDRRALAERARATIAAVVDAHSRARSAADERGTGEDRDEQQRCRDHH